MHKDTLQHFQRWKSAPLVPSRTGGVLRAVPSAAVVGARRFFFQGANSGMQQSWRPFLVVTLKTQVFTVSTNAQTLHSIPRGQVPSKHFIFFEGGACILEGGGAPVPWHNGTMASPSLLLPTPSGAHHDTMKILS